MTCAVQLTIITVCYVSYYLPLQIKYIDVICLNKYYGWYSDPGHLETIRWLLSRELDEWHARHKKPIIITEYGAEAVSGIHEVQF